MDREIRAGRGTGRGPRGRDTYWDLRAGRGTERDPPGWGTHWDPPGRDMERDPPGWGTHWDPPVSRATDPTVPAKGWSTVRYRTAPRWTRPELHSRARGRRTLRARRRWPGF